MTSILISIDPTNYGPSVKTTYMDVTNIIRSSNGDFCFQLRHKDGSTGQLTFPMKKPPLTHNSSEPTSRSNGLKNGESTLRLPAELHHQIMDCASHDIRSLRCAALTCRAWLAAARPLLFRFVQVKNSRQMNNLLGAIRSSPMIAECIRTIRIGDPKASDPFFRDTSVTAFLDALVELEPPLRNLCALEMYGVVETWSPKMIRKLARLTSVSTLFMGKCGVSPDELGALISALPGLRHLKIEYCAGIFHGRLKHMALPQQYPPALTSLAIEDRSCLNEGLDSLLDCILSSRSRHTIRSVKFMIGQENTQAVGEFLWAIGQNLERLELGFWTSIETLSSLSTSTSFHIALADSLMFLTEALDHINLSHNTGLRELTLHDPTFPLIPTLLQQVHSQYLHQIIFRWAPKAFLCASRAELAKVLATPRFRMVKNFRFIYDGSHDESMEPRMKAAFRMLDEKGILVVRPAKCSDTPH